ncbi:uncharacterized protein HMPREF1541_08025 [Cyphellophora europaea CBS 101466]|uniref:Nop14-like protein n=1 Tax=Cyphellophora europaea (strain CBS 101466) TaxID=1220924 RepID=W2RKM9_CYPE1|nr:uncharacterized protein HMPREF1541_08025 [Cyphellophora europaea CBS 101466]ETN37036.1 hypothetical protein HMPREF1541_08025 [Cyphellophora europaea CBS 101466]
MAPSQLKQLKASLRETGVFGPQKSKKQRKANAKDAQNRLQRNAALDDIREKFNPFEAKAPARRQKHEVFSNKVTKPTVGRPGVTRGLGEDRRRETLLRELQSRNRVGGLLDRRFGENDPTLTPEERAAERFARQNERKLRKSTMFNLEDESEEEMTLTHAGRSLDFSGQVVDDYEQGEIDRNGADEFEDQDDRPKKRMRLEDEDNASEGETVPERKKTKNEVMQEIIAKSKMHKAERQAAKEDDDDLRMELDMGMTDLYEVMRTHKPAAKPLPTPPSDSEPQMDPSRAAMLAGKSREDAEKEYEANIRQMKMDARSKPTFRTKTEEEKAVEEAERLQELERKRQRRMRGEADSSDEEGEGEIEDAAEDEEPDDAEAFGLSAPAYAPRPQLEVEDEDEFVIDDDLIASGSEPDPASDEEDSDSESGRSEDDDGDDDFINGLVLPSAQAAKGSNATVSNKDLAYTYPCPQTHQELLDLLRDKAVSDVPTVVQRIRALYHKGLAEGNQAKLGRFAHVLTAHVAYMVDNDDDFQGPVVESLLRHLHSMAKDQPQEVAAAFRNHLATISEKRPLALTAGDVMMLTGVSMIFPTSDHFHTVATPAMLTVGRYLGQSSVQTLQDLGLGAYCCSLALQYQKLAKRYVPETIMYIVNAIAILSPTKMPETMSLQDFEGRPLGIPIRMPESSLRIKFGLKEKVAPKASFKTLVHRASASQSQSLSLLHTFIHLAHSVTNLWTAKTAYPELILPLAHALSHLSTTSLPTPTHTLASTTLQHLLTTLSTSTSTRKPLLLHNHRPLAIKTSIPQFLDNYNPNKHNDPDIERAQLNKLKAEHKKERKGAMRELRKDANFVAREQLREKKAKDEAYEKKFKRLVAEIQGEEGREAKEYEKEKRRRKDGR